MKCVEVECANWPFSDGTIASLVLANPDDFQSETEFRKACQDSFPGTEIIPVVLDENGSRKILGESEMPSRLKSIPTSNLAWVRRRIRI